MRKLHVFATVLALTAVCAFSDEDLHAGAGTATAEESSDAGFEGVQAAGEANGGEEVAEASEGASDAAEGDFEPNPPGGTEAFEE